MKDKQQETYLHFSQKNRKYSFQKHKTDPRFQTSTKNDSFVTALDQMCKRFEKTLEHQNTRLYQMETRYGKELCDRFDKLISVSQRINDKIQNIFTKALQETLPQKNQPRQRSTPKKSFSLIDQVINDEIQNKQQNYSVSLEQEQFSTEQKQQQNRIIIGDPLLKDKLILTSLLERKLSKTTIYNLFKDISSKNWVQTSSQSVKQFNKYVGSFYNREAEHYYELYSTGKISYEQIKIKFSTDIFNQLIEFQGQWIEYILSLKLQELGKCHSNGKRFFKLFNEASNQSLKFLIHKYPPPRANVVDSELTQKIKEIKQYSVFKYDLLKNADMEFGLEKGQTDFSKQIKIWINKLIIQTRKQYPQFKQTMKLLFSGNDGSFIGSNQDVEFQYLISAKIPQSSQLYSQQQIDAPGLLIKNPEILRILMKWYEQLIVYFTNPEQKILSNRFGFKSIHNKSIPIRIPQSKLELLAKNLKQIYDQQIKNIESQQHFNIGVFIEGLVSISMGGIDGYDFINERQIIVSKMSQCLYEAFKSYLLTFLNLSLSKLVKIRSKYDSQSFESNIQLITFGVMDILRCRCTGSKQQIYRIYNQIRKNTDYFEIIRVKNKLNQPTRDILINLKLKQSFLICQVQLALGSSKQHAAGNFCHYLYELQRSKFGVLFECASQIYNLDPKIEYLKKHPKISFKRNSVIQLALMDRIRVTDGLQCNSCHPYNTMVQVPNTKPLVCLCCMSFIPGYFNKLPYYRCKVCNFTICHECSVILAKKSDKMMKKTFKLTLPSGVHLPSDTYHKCFKFVGLFDKKLIQSQILNVISEYHEYVLLLVIDNNNFNFGVFKKYKDGVVQTFSTISQIHQINFNTNAVKAISTILPLKPFEIKKIHQIQQYRKIHINMSWCKLQTIFIQNKIQQVVCVIAPQKKVCFIIDVIERQSQIQWHKQRRQAQKIAQTCNKSKGDCIQITSKKIDSLDFLNIVERKQLINILNLWENKIQDISILEKFFNIEQLYLQDNKIKSIQPILHMTKLQLLSVGNNQIIGSLPQLNLPQLQYLAITDNPCTDVSNLSSSNINSLILLKLSNTFIEKLSKMNFPKLQIIKADNCRINDISEFSLSDLPSLSKLNLQCNRIQGEFLAFKFPKLSSFRVYKNKITSLQIFSKSQLPSLVSLNASHNNISSCLSVIQLKQLIELDLSYNNIFKIGPQILINSNFPQLQRLLLRNNKLSQSPPFIQLPNLKKLDLGQNILRSFSIEQKYLFSLQYLHLDHNNIQIITIIKHSNLKSIDISNNQIESILPLQNWRIPLTKQIKLNNNKISSIIPRLYMSSVQIIDLSHNNIRQQQICQYLHLIPNITKIKLFQNSQQLLQNITRKWKSKQMKYVDFDQSLSNKQ